MLGLIAFYGLIKSLKARREILPFVFSVVFFFAGYLGLIASRLSLCRSAQHHLSGSGSTTGNLALHPLGSDHRLAPGPGVYGL